MVPLPRRDHAVRQCASPVRGNHVRRGHGYTMAFVILTAVRASLAPRGELQLFRHRFALHRPLFGPIKRSRERIRFRTARQYPPPPSIREPGMANHPMFLSRSMTVMDLIRACDPFSDEVAQAFLRSEVCSPFLPAFALIEGWCRGWNGLSTTPSKIPRSNSRTSMVLPGRKRLNHLRSTLALRL